MPLYIKIDENNKITDIEFPSVVEINGVKCTVTSIGPVFSLADHSLLGWRYIWQGVLSEITSVVLPSTITSIEDYAFSYCDSLLDVTIPDTVTSIGEHAFLGCENLEEIVIPDAVTSIGDMAFSGCDNLSDITFSDNINMIGDYAFQGTAWLENQPDGELYIGNVYYGYIGQMQDNTSITIREGTKAIASEAFYECEGLTNITVPNSVTYIGYRAFSGTTWLENQPEGDLYIGSVYYRYIGQMPANNNVEIKNGTTAIAYGAFNSDDEMISITMPDSVEYIGDGAFAGCKKLTNVNLSKNLKKINSGLFSSCDNLTSITIPNRVKSIETQAFLYCPNLTNITISENLERIGQNAFNGTKIKSITLPQSIRSIGYYSFGGCTELENITILSDERCIISTNSFSGCNNVTTINIKAEENSIYGAPWGASSSATINWNYTGN